MSQSSDQNSKTIKKSTFVVIVVLLALASAGVSALLVSIFERKQEARNP